MATTLKLISKEELIEKFKEIEAKGWIKCPSKRKNNDGSVGNLLEDLLGIPENNLPIPNAAEWELKAQRAETSSLVTLCHQEPSPRAAKLVPDIQDYTQKNQVIDFDDDIDKQLFKLFGLTDAEKKYVIERAKEYKE